MTNDYWNSHGKIPHVRLPDVPDSNISIMASFPHNEFCDPAFLGGLSTIQWSFSEPRSELRSRVNIGLKGLFRKKCWKQESRPPKPVPGFHCLPLLCLDLRLSRVNTSPSGSVFSCEDRDLMPCHLFGVPENSLCGSCWIKTIQNTCF